MPLTTHKVYFKYKFFIYSFKDPFTPWNSHSLCQISIPISLYHIQNSLIHPYLGSVNFYHFTYCLPFPMQINLGFFHFSLLTVIVTFGTKSGNRIIFSGCMRSRDCKVLILNYFSYHTCLCKMQDWF